MDNWGELGALKYAIFPTREEMGRKAAQDVEQAMVEQLAGQKTVRIIFAAAPSQAELLAGLASSERIDWSRVEAFHMDEYVGLPADAPAGFGNFLRRHLFDRVPLQRMELLNGQAADTEAECQRYRDLLGQQRIDMVCLGIGENGHIAFNDPPVADFQDPETVKVVELDHVCRQQQVNDGCFAKLADVPRRAYTLTIPALVAAERLFCVVPALSKSGAVHKLFQGPVETACPASLLRTLPGVRLYLDQDAASKIHG